MNFPDTVQIAPASLITLADAKALLGISDTTHDAQLQFSLDLASQLIVDYTGRRLVKGTYTDRFLFPRRSLELTEFPVESITSISPANSYILHRSVGTLYFDQGCPHGEVVVEYVAGYDPLPPTLVAVLMELVKRQLVAMGVNLGAGAAVTGGPPVKSVTVGTLRVDYALKPTEDGTSSSGSPISSKIMNDYADILSMYRHPRLMAATP